MAETAKVSVFCLFVLYTLLLNLQERQFEQDWNLRRIIMSFYLMEGWIYLYLYVFEDGFE